MRHDASIFCLTDFDGLPVPMPEQKVRGPIASSLERSSVVECCEIYLKLVGLAFAGDIQHVLSRNHTDSNAPAACSHAQSFFC